MSCASVKCGSKNVSATLRKRCCGITPTVKSKPKSNNNQSIASRALGGEKPEGRPASIFERAIDPSKLSKEEKETRTHVPLILGGKPADSDDDDVDKDCNSWGWLKPLCVGGKSATKGYNNCMGLPFNCGYVVVGALSVFLLFQILR